MGRHKPLLSHKEVLPLLWRRLFTMRDLPQHAQQGSNGIHEENRNPDTSCCAAGASEKYGVDDNLLDIGPEMEDLQIYGIIEEFDDSSWD